MKPFNIKEELLKEHSKKQRDKIIDYIGCCEIKFNELMDLFFKGDYILTQRASWPLSIIAEKHSQIFLPYLNKSIEVLTSSTIHPAVKRNLLRIFQFIQIPEEQQGVLVEICMQFLKNKDTPIAIKAFSLSTLENICKHYPDLSQEVANIISEKILLERPAVKVRYKRFIDKIERGLN